MSFAKICRWGLRFLIVLVVIFAALVGSLYIFVHKGDVRGYINQAVTPYAPHLKIEGPIALKVWPSLHLEAENVTNEPYKIDRLRLHLPLIPLVRFIIWRAPQKDMKLDVDGFVMPGVDPVNANMACQSQGEVFDCSVDATMKAWKTKLAIRYNTQEDIVQAKGDINYNNNTLHVVESTMHAKTLAFDGRVMLVGRSPLVIATPKPIDVHYSDNMLTLKAPVLGLPSVELHNLQLKVKHHDKTVDILVLEADACQGHISTTGRITWPQVTLKGNAKGIALESIKELKEYVKKGTGQVEWHVTCNAEKAMETLSGNTHVQLNPVDVVGIDLAHLRQAVQQLNRLSLGDIPNLKDKLIKPGVMPLVCDFPITWQNGNGTIQKGRVTASDIHADVSGHFNVKQVDAKAVVDGLSSWPPLTVLIKGPWENIEYTPDWQSMIKLLLKQTFSSASKTIGNAVRDNLKEAIDGDGKAGTNIGQTLQQEAGKLLGGLFGKRS